MSNGAADLDAADAGLPEGLEELLELGGDVALAEASADTIANSVDELLELESGTTGKNEVAREAAVGVLHEVVESAVSERVSDSTAHDLALGVVRELVESVETTNGSSRTTTSEAAVGDLHEVVVESVAAETAGESHDLALGVVHEVVESVVAAENEKFGDEKSEEPELVVAVVGFHHTRGNVVERVYPSAFEAELASSDELAFGALPDGAHHATGADDWCYLSVRRKKGAWHGVTCVRQVAVSTEKRGHVQKALCALCAAPRYGELRDRLRAVALAFDAEFGEAVVAGAHASLARSLRSAPSAERGTWGLGCRRLFTTLGAAVTWRCVKALLLERSCIFVHERSMSTTSDLALSLVALVPEALEASVKAMSSSRSVLDDDDTGSRANDCGAWYCGALVGERCRVEPSASLAHLDCLSEHVARRRPGTLVVCGCSNPHLAKGHVAPLYSFDGDKPAVVVQLAQQAQSPPRRESGSAPALFRLGASPRGVSFQVSSTKDNGGSSSSSGSSANAERTKRSLSPPPGAPRDEDEDDETPSDPLGSASWRPTKCEREYLDAIDDACSGDELDFVDGDDWCLKAARRLVARMISDVAATDPADREAVADLADRWSGDFLYAWFTTTRSAAEWALVFAPEWSRLIARRKDLGQLLRPNLYARLLHTSAHASQQIGRHAENILTSTMTALNDNIAAVQREVSTQYQAATNSQPPPEQQPTQRRASAPSKAASWFASAAARSLKASTDVIDGANAARNSATRALVDARDAATPSIVSFYSSLNDVATAAASFATRAAAPRARSSRSPPPPGSPPKDAPPENSPAPATRARPQPGHDDDDPNEVGV